MSGNEENLQVLSVGNENLSLSNMIGTECQASEESDDDFCALDLLLSNIWSMLGQELNSVGDVKRKVKFNSFSGQENNPSILSEFTLHPKPWSSQSVQLESDDHKNELDEEIPLEKIKNAEIANNTIGEGKLNHTCSDSSQEKSTETGKLVGETRLTERQKVTNSSPKLTIEECESFDNNNNISENFNISNSARQQKEFHQKPTKGEYSKYSFLPRNFLAKKPRAFTFKEVFMCGECQKKFMFESALIIHMKKHDKQNHFTSKKVYKCKNCQRKFTFGRALITHMQKHDKRNLNLHEIGTESTHHGLNLKTSIPPIPNPVAFENVFKPRTRQKRFINEYISLRDNDEPNTYKCEKCPKEFSFKSQLRRHNTVHMEEKPFKCDHCDYSSKWKHALTRHVKGCHES